MLLNGLMPLGKKGSAGEGLRFPKFAGTRDGGYWRASGPGGRAFSLLNFPLF